MLVMTLQVHWQFLSSFSLLDGTILEHTEAGSQRTQEKQPAMYDHECLVKLDYQHIISNNYSTITYYLRCTLISRL